MAAGKTGKVFLSSPRVFDPKHFTHSVAVTGGKLVFLAGQVSYDREGRVLGKGDIRAQCERVFECIGHNLAIAGAGFHDIIKLNAYLVASTPEAIRVYRDVRSRYLNAAQLPASTLVGVESLAHADLLIEVEAIACVQVPAPARKTAAARRPRKRAVHAAKKRAPRR